MRRKPHITIDPRDPKRLEVTDIYGGVTCVHKTDTIALKILCGEDVSYPKKKRRGNKYVKFKE